MTSFLFVQIVSCGVPSPNAASTSIAPSPVSTATSEPLLVIPENRITLTALPPKNITATSTVEFDDVADYYGGLVITLDYVGKTISMKPGQGFLLKLGNGFSWTVSIEPEDLLTMNLRITPKPEEQGVFIARKKGTVFISAIGVPDCLSFDPPCARPSVIFRMSVHIQ